MPEANQIAGFDAFLDLLAERIAARLQFPPKVPDARLNFPEVAA